jgi:serine/threonine protein kinase
MADRVGKQLGNYRLVSLLGRGGYAEVYLGQHVRFNMQAAVKVLHAHLSGKEAEHFKQEAETIAALRHSAIVRVLDFDVQEGVPFLVMDYASNGSLRRRHPQGEVVPLPQIVSYVKQVAGAIQYAHEHKVIHRDVKPENMLVGRDEEVLLSDFGLAALAHSSTSLSTQEAMGTLAYMAPEQIEGHPRPASDQYALGVTIYEWLCGQRPFKGSFTELVTQHLWQSPPPPHERASGIAPPVEQVVLRALAKDPKQRFVSVAAFAAALEQASQDALLPAAPGSPGLLTEAVPPASRAVVQTELAISSDASKRPTEYVTLSEQATDLPSASAWGTLLKQSQVCTESFFEDVQGTPEHPGAFIPEVYIQRADVEDTLNQFLNSSAAALIVIGEAGIGKTNLLCAWTQRLLQEGHVVFLYNCGLWNDPDVKHELMRDLALKSPDEVQARLEDINSLAVARGKQCLLIFDSLNEFYVQGLQGHIGPDTLLKDINALVGRLPSKNVRVVLSWRTSTWRRLDSLGTIRLSKGRYYRPSMDDLLLHLQPFTSETFELAYAQYHDVFHLYTPLVKLPIALRERLRNPLLLRLLAEAYHDRNEPIAHETFTLGIFRRLYEDRVKVRSDMAFLDELAKEMLSQRRTLLSVHDLMSNERLRPDITGDDSNSSYDRLQDNGVLTEISSNSYKGNMLKFTYDPLGGYILARYLLLGGIPPNVSLIEKIKELIGDVQQFPLAWDTARTVLVLHKDRTLFADLAQSTDADLRQLVVESLVELHYEEPATALEIIGELLQKDSQEAQRTALKVAYAIPSDTQEIFISAATDGTAALRRTTKDILYLIWHSDPQFTYDLLQKLSESIGMLSLTNTRGRNTLEVILDLLTTIYINHCDQEQVIEALDTIFYELAKNRLHLDRLNTRILGPLEKTIVQSTVSSFAKPVLDTFLLTELVPAERFFSIPVKDRECIKRIAPFLDPQTDIQQARDDLTMMLKSDVIFFHAASAQVLAVHAYRNFATTEPFLRKLFAEADGQGRLWMIFSFCIPMKSTPLEWRDIVEEFTRTLIEEHPAIFYKEELSLLNLCDVALLALGLVYGKGGLSMPYFEALLGYAFKDSNRRLVERCITGLGTVGFYYPQPVFHTLRTAIPNLGKAGLDNALADCLSLIRALHFDEVDIFLSQIGADETLRREIAAKTDVALVSRQIYTVGLLNNEVHYSVFYPKMRQRFSIGALNMLAEARKPEDFLTNYSLATIHFVQDTNFRVKEWFSP